MTIANVEEIVIGHHAGWSWLGFILGGIGIIIWLSALIHNEFDVHSTILEILGVIVGACLMGTSVGLFLTAGPEDTVNQYEIICESDFTYPQDFIESHTFIEKRGDIWVWQDNWEGGK